ncbi:MAG: glycosyltransferase family 39 protein, partial [Candidatus Omnitrophica bacterium]|nr:glycosyltransferase family 39 protein [Candidatus Omnitrophota bacterium]
MQKTSFLADKKNIKFSIFWISIFLFVVVLLSLYDLTAPPISPTIWRQTQTAMLTENFAREGFNLNGLYVNLRGNQKLMMIYEFPIYNFVVGVFFLIFNASAVFWGKLVSLISVLVSFFYLFKLTREVYGKSVAVYASLFFLFAPIRLLLTTAVQPDALGVMLMLMGLSSLLNWKRKKLLKDLSLFCFFLLLAGWTKFPIIVPYILIIGSAILFDKGRVRFPETLEIVVYIGIFLVPFTAWYLFRGYISCPEAMSDKINMFLIGDLTRFLSPEYYVKPFFVLGALVFCASGILFFLAGLKKLSAVGWALVGGVPFYFILVPTVRNQYYYLYPLVPIFSVIMARGFLIFRNYCDNRKLKQLFYGSIAVFVIGFIISGTSALRHDKVPYYAANALKKNSLPTDLVFSLNMHDRGQGVGGENPAMMYLANRKGWNATQGS